MEWIFTVSNKELQKEREGAVIYPFSIVKPGLGSGGAHIIYEYLVEQYRPEQGYKVKATRWENIGKVVYETEG